MSNIVIFLDQEANRADVVLRLQKATQKSLSDIRSSLMNNAPVVEVELFEGDYDSHAKMLRAVMSCMLELSLGCRIYELPEGETMETCSFVDKCEITPTVLENILSEADAELDRQLGE
ncbi:hypothetical protein DTL42_17970 [Bremerella cremea]|uniref:Uncharacterized protein n=1 Tax=Bremerella cremea TaxID=1031537 RepID=A0A368KQ29_9BACT|nr:hypothetical protein [Bremerella cremea]RCS44019.1 hypothetical protein DTL42_17970 [Bremerella cremea]